MLERQCNMQDTPNGFSNMNVTKMIESSRNWNLANDIELLKCLEKFSENIINNATFTLSSMDNLEDSLNETFLKVRTVANKFQAIADNQFIENRVQEEEDFVLANDEKDTPENQPSPESSKVNILECIRDCQHALGKKFETVQLSGIDSEDEMANSSPVVLVPKNVYKERRLPHLIGGEQFKKDETLGLGPAGHSMDESTESDEDVDETDRSSYYSGNATKDIAEVEPVKSLGKPATNEHLEWNQPPKDYIPEPPPFRSTYLSYDPPRIDNEPPPLSNDLFTNTLLPEEPILYESPDKLFEDDPDPNSLEPSASDFFKDDGEILRSEETKRDEPISAPSNSSVSREQLLSGRNFASFKEDLARVLSGAKMQRKSSSIDSDDSKGDLSSPAQGNSSKEVGATANSPPPLLSSSHSSPAIRSTSLPGGSTHIASPNVTSHGNSSPVTFPSVSTNVLESLAKGRAKVKGRRRPPSRKHRQANIDGESPSNEQYSNASNSTHSEDTSVHESSSTQPGSNILSPATDEEDLFVLPAFDLPSDPPNRGLFFGNSLLSPGTIIDDGGLSHSPLFPADPLMEKPSMGPPSTETSPHVISAYAPISSSNISPEKFAPIKNIVQPKTESRDNGSSNLLPTDQFTSNENNANEKHTVVADLPREFVVDTELFSEKNLKTDDLNEKLDIFSSTNSNKNEFSSSPPLFTDLAKPSFSSKATSKSAPRSSLRSGLKWDLLSSDDLGEELFRSQKKESPEIHHSKHPKTPQEVKEREKKPTNIFSPSSSFEQSGSKTLFGDGSDYSSSDIFAESSTFMGLSLPKDSRDSLFASDDDEDDDSLFKSSKTTSILKAPVGSTEPPRTSQVGNRNVPKNASSRELMSDPLSSMDQFE